MSLPTPSSPLPPGLRNPAYRTITNPTVHDRAHFTQYASEDPSAPYTLVTITQEPGGAIPLHFHRHVVETFSVLKGALGVHLAGTQHLLQAGETLHVLTGNVHRFYNPGAEDVTFQVAVEGTATDLPTRVAQAEGFEKILYIVYGLAHDGMVWSDGMPRNPLYLSVVAHLRDTNIAWAGGFLVAGLMRGLGFAAWMAGSEEWLVERYWTRWGENMNWIDNCDCALDEADEDLFAACTGYLLIYL